MLTLLLTSWVWAADPPAPDAKPTHGTLVVDSHLPAEVLIDGKTIGQLFQDATLRVEVPSGLRMLRVYTNGQPQDLSITMPADGEIHLLIGRTGVTVDQQSALSDDDEQVMVPIQIRVAGSVGVQLVVERERYALKAGEQRSLEWASGDHQVSVRSHDGTVVWARGTLTVSGKDLVLVQLSEGRLPEVSGQARFTSGG